MFIHSVFTDAALSKTKPDLPDDRSVGWWQGPRMACPPLQKALQFDKDYQLGTRHLQAFSAGIRSEIFRLFDDLLKIGIAHSPRLTSHPVDWAKTHLGLLLDENRHMVTLWIKRVCDEQDFSKPLNTDKETEDYIFWKDWRAPKLIVMQPSGNLPYNGSTAWDREDQAKSEKLLENLSQRFVQFLGFDLEEIAGDAHVELAKTAELTSGDDLSFELMAIEEARKSVPEDEGPRPKVGAVVVKNGNVLSRAHRGERPKSHAEYVALEQKLSDEMAAGSTVYTTLEPCTTRKHPKIPCAQRLVERRVARVVIGMLDPNPDIRGLGVQLLNEAGIETQLFPRDLAAQVEEMNREFIRFQKEKHRNSKMNQGARAAARPVTEQEAGQPMISFEETLPDLPPRN
jgi:pyrimidine deaminase RibD-like protein